MSLTDVKLLNLLTFEQKNENKTQSSCDHVTEIPVKGFTAGKVGKNVHFNHIINKNIGQVL